MRKKKIGHSSNMLVSRQEGKRQNSSSLILKSKKGRDMEELPKMAGIIFFNKRCIYSLIIIIHEKNLFLIFLWSNCCSKTVLETILWAGSMTGQLPSLLYTGCDITTFGNMGKENHSLLCNPINREVISLEKHFLKYYLVKFPAIIEISMYYYSYFTKEDTKGQRKRDLSKSLR